MIAYQSVILIRLTVSQKDDTLRAEAIMYIVAKRYLQINMKQQ